MERGLQRSPQADEDFVAAFVKDAPCAGVAVRCHAYPDRLRSLPNGAEILQDQRHPADQDGPPLVRLATLGMVSTRTLSEDRLRSGRLSAGPRPSSGSRRFRERGQAGSRSTVPEGAIGAGLVPRDIGVSSASETAMTERQIPTESLRHSTSPRGMRYPPALASACVAAFVAISPRIGLSWKGSVPHATVQATSVNVAPSSSIPEGRVRRSISRGYA